LELLVLDQLEYLERVKMTKPMIRFVDLDTDEVVDREMTNAEFAQYEADQEALAILEAETKAKADAKETAQAKLAVLGLTVEDLQALGL
jgi:hypothetical protein